MEGPTIDDSEGLRRACNTQEGLYDFGESTYIAETFSLEDVADWPKLPSGRVHRTKRYKDAAFHLDMKDKKPKRLVGHSLGAAVAQRLGEDMGIEVRGSSI